MDQNLTTIAGPAPVNPTTLRARGERDYARTALRAAIVAVLLAEAFDGASYRWRRASRRMTAWEATIEHRRRTRRYAAELQALAHQLATRR